LPAFKTLGIGVEKRESKEKSVWKKTNKRGRGKGGELLFGDPYEKGNESEQHALG